ncbi:laccase 2 VT [Gymnopus androsaceus JB14]|uniref:Laccase 2 VT n=1 Tax=Gymnopus androsaceus JB14 TaxID=1447944 RepID=A0A6A4HM37_9AGAR|nr:laccase 2 VT [Gymnopus androsaceus JB14]
MLSLLLLASVSGAFASIGPVADLNIVNGFIQPDGFNRSFVLAEGVFPGPLIVGNIGDNFQINVIDSLTNDTMLLSTSIHWHGLFQATTNWADGPYVYKQRFLYLTLTRGPVKLAPSGTILICLHSTAMVCVDLLFIYDPDDPYADLYDVDDDSTVITLADWYHVPAPLAGAAPTPGSTLINGLGIAYTGGGSLAVISVVQGTRYRFRLVSISCDPNYIFSIDSHTFTVIEVDGVNHLPVVADSIQIYAAQRYSFVLTANQSISNYWIRANPNRGTAGFLGGINSAILRYANAPIANPITLDTSINLLAETSLAPRENPGAPGTDTPDGVDLALNLALSFAAPDFEINGVSFVPPTVPVLLQIISGATTAASLLPAGSVYALPLNSSIQLSFNALTVAAIGGPVSSRPQFSPFLLADRIFSIRSIFTGHNFDVIRPQGSIEYNYANPVRRDVVATGTGSPLDNVTIRFMTDNAGPWFLHCHIDWHLEAGFAIVFAEDAPDTAAANPTPDDWNQLCPIYDSLTPEQLGGGGGPTV